MRNFIRLICLSFLIISCNSKDDSAVLTDSDNNIMVEEEAIPLAKSYEAAPPPDVPVASFSGVPDQSLSTPVSVVNKKIIKDGKMGIGTQELEKAKQKVDSLVKANGGYYANETLDNTETESIYTLSIRIPGDKFEKFIAQVESGEKEILNKSIQARDVTDQFIDLETRLANKKSYVIRYRDLLKQARNVKEILEIEEQIRALEEEIESTTGRLNYLSDQVNFSTLELTIVKEKEFKYSPSKRTGFWQELKQSLSKGWFGFVDLLIFLIKIWPLYIIVAVAVYLWKKFRKRRKSKKS